MGIPFFISFCVNGIRSVSNDKHLLYAMINGHAYSIALIFDELFFCVFFSCKSILPMDFACLLSTDEVRGI